MRRYRHPHFHGRFDGHRYNATEYIAVNTRLCKACWKCVSICPKIVLGKVDFCFHRHVRIVNPENCTGCGACAKTCPEGAIMVLKRPEARQNKSTVQDKNP